jgi:hypothetical protein
MRQDTESTKETSTLHCSHSIKKHITHYISYTHPIKNTTQAQHTRRQRDTEETLERYNISHSQYTHRTLKFTIYTKRKNCSVSNIFGKIHLKFFRTSYDEAYHILQLIFNHTTQWTTFFFIFIIIIMIIKQS